MKKKVLVLSDHALSTSGVGVQTRFLIQGLLDRYPGEWTFRQFGAAVKHANYETHVVNEDFIIKPVDGFGSRDMIRLTLATEKPDILLIFTDPRFFIWLFEMEDEIHQVCPIAWWHVWDNNPRPDFNDVLYESTDLINCHSYVTYEICAEKHAHKTNFVPHAFPKNIYRELPQNEIDKWKPEVLGPDRADHFIVFWVNRNAKRKRPNDMLWAWQIFLDKLQEKHGHKKASLLLHTDPRDAEGPNLLATAEMLGIQGNVIFSNDRIEFEQMNILHNIADITTNISYAEGFGLPTLEAMMTGTPIVALKTGGQTRQVVDHRDGTENGIALPVEFRSMVGSQNVPFIYEDYVSVETIADSYLKMYEMKPEDRRALGQKAKAYADAEFNYDDVIDRWHDTLLSTYHKFKDQKARWSVETL